ncbi:MAG TPA: sporulation protein YqfC [Thermoanaerobacterales bacterium]|nr:sporulation protein YqfC [Thermoanaerobacterales bacterium]
MSDGIKKRISDALELPGDIVLNLPRVIVTGNISVFVENHKGIVEYDSDRIRINTAAGTVIVKGEGLLIKSLVADEVTIEGRLKLIEFEE